VGTVTRYLDLPGPRGELGRLISQFGAEVLVRPGEFGGRYVCELLISLPDSSA
jgi:hypothetical protein